MRAALARQDRVKLRGFGSFTACGSTAAARTEAQRLRDPLSLLVVRHRSAVGTSLLNRLTAINVVKLPELVPSGEGSSRSVWRVDHSLPFFLRDRSDCPTAAAFRSKGVGHGGHAAAKPQRVGIMKSRTRVKFAAALISSGLSGCGLTVPEVGEFWDRDYPGDPAKGSPTLTATAQIEYEIKQKVYCELRHAVQDAETVPVLMNSAIGDYLFPLLGEYNCN